MKRTTVILAAAIILLIGGAVFVSKYGQDSTKVSVNTLVVGDKTAATREENKNSASATVGYIDFDSTIVTEQNLNELNAELYGKLDKSALGSSTLIVLVMNNHREDLSAFNYKELATLDGAAAQDWQQVSERMGGHHVTGILTFPKTENPRSLTIKGLPVGDAILTF